MCRLEAKRGDLEGIRGCTGALGACGSGAGQGGAWLCPLPGRHVESCGGAVYTRHGPAERQTSLSTEGPYAETCSGLQRESAAQCVTGEPSSTTGERVVATAAAPPSAGHCRRGTRPLARLPPCAMTTTRSMPMPMERRATSTTRGHAMLREFRRCEERARFFPQQSLPPLPPRCGKKRSSLFT